MSNTKPRKDEAEDELARIDALIAQHDVDKTLPEPVGRPRGPAASAVRYGDSAGMPPTRRGGDSHSEVPPPWYRCHRCGEGGHYVQNCAVNNEDHSILKQVKQARGIPRAFLQKATEEDLKRSGVGGYVTATGDLVVMKQASVEEKARILGETEDMLCQRFFGSSTWEAQKKLLNCPLCKSLCKNAIVVPCCSSMYCRDCLMKHLEKTYSVLDESVRNRQCPNCPEIIHVDKIIPDLRIQQFISQILFGEQAPLRTRLRAAATLPISTASINDNKSGTPSRKKHVQLNLSVSLEQDDFNENIRMFDKVPAGRLNPFFSPVVSQEQGDSDIMTEEEFGEWKESYKASIISQGLWGSVQEKLRISR